MNKKQAKELDIIKPVFRKVYEEVAFCPQCKEQLRGNDSMAKPYKCSCGTWEHIHKTFYYRIKK